MLLFSFSSFQNIYQNIYCSSTLSFCTTTMYKNPLLGAARGGEIAEYQTGIRYAAYPESGAA